jgi:hypothetical protein
MASTRSSGSRRRQAHYAPIAVAPARVLPWTSSDLLGLPGAGIEPARGFPQGIFVLATAFAAARQMHAFGVWTLPLPCRARARVRQGPSSLYTFRAAHRLGLARGCSHPYVDWFSDFDPIHTRRFRTGCSITLSPLRLPISPPGQGRRGDSTEDLSTDAG